MNSSPKKHHYVPECYLKGFVNTQKQFWRRSKYDKKCTICTPGQVAYEIDTNRIRTPEIMEAHGMEDSNFIETHSFKKQENNYLKTHSKVIRYSSNPIIIDRHDYRLFLETLVTIKRRNPQTRNQIIQAFVEGYSSKEAIPQYKEYLLEEATKNGANLPEDLDKYLENYLKTRATNPNWVHDMYLLGHIKSKEYDIVEKMTKQLYTLKQILLHTPIGTQFITSDNPGFTKIENMVRNAGGMGQPFEHYFPISPNTCLYLNSAIVENSSLIEKSIHPTTISETQVDEINQLTKTISNNKLFGHSKKVLESI